MKLALGVLSVGGRAVFGVRGPGAGVLWDGERPVGTTVTFKVVAGPHLGATGTGVTNAAGVATFAYTGTLLGTDTIEATFLDSLTRIQRSNRVEKIWVAAEICRNGIDDNGIGGIDEGCTPPPPPACKDDESDSKGTKKASSSVASDSRRIAAKTSLVKLGSSSTDKDDDDKDDDDDCEEEEDDDDDEDDDDKKKKDKKDEKKSARR